MPELPTPSKTESAPAAEAPASWERPRSLMIMAIWFGLFTGACETIFLFVLHQLHRCILDFVSPIIWTIPFVDAAVFALPGLVFCIWAWRRGISARLRKIALLIFCTLALSLIAFSICSVLIVMLFPPAIVLLAAGIATQVARLAATRQRLVHLLFVRSGLAMVTLALLAGLTTQVRYWWNEHRLLQTLPAAAPGAPNVLLVVLDTVRAKSLSLYGYAKDTTPNLKRWASRGLVFDQAIAPSPFTLTSHASMFTGRYPHELAADWTVPLEAGCPTLAEILHDHGYLTAGFVANTYYAGRQSGLNRGFGAYLAHRLTPLEILVSSTLCRNLLKIPRHSPPARAINDYFSSWIAHTPKRPFFAFINYCDAHVPYEPEPQDQTVSLDEERQVIFWGIAAFMAQQPETDTALLGMARDAYDNCLKGLDRRVGELLQGLEARGDLKNTIVVIAGDHGEQFGEHNLIQHTDSLYRSAIHVPLLIIAPNSPAAGQRVHQLVTLRDLPATILDLLKIPQGGIGGDSFAAAITIGPDAPLPDGPKFAYVSQGTKYTDWHPNARGPIGAVFLDGKYYLRGPAEEELYDFQADPEEEHNLIDLPASRPLLERLRPLLPSRANKGQP